MKSTIKLFILGLFLFTIGCTSTTPSKSKAEITEELKAFMESYQQDLIAGDREKIAQRYHSEGYHHLTGNYQFSSYDSTVKYYQNNWIPPIKMSFDNLIYEVIDESNAQVMGEVNWVGPTENNTMHLTYMSFLTKEEGKWKIKIENEYMGYMDVLSAMCQTLNDSTGYWYQVVSQKGGDVEEFKRLLCN